MSGVPITVNALPTVTPTNADSVPIWDSESGTQGRATISTLGNIFARLDQAVTFASSVTAGTAVIVSAFDAGAGGGPVVRIANNNNGTTPSPGYIHTSRADGANCSLYADNSSVWRTVNSFTVTSANFAGGIIVGTQTSTIQEKDVEGDVAPLDDVLAAVAEGAAAVRRFRYKPASARANGR